MEIISMPDSLRDELDKMRRNTQHFTVKDALTCHLCGTKERRTLRLLNAKSEICGTWCPIHSWLSFDSVENPPTERLTESEVEERRLTQSRSERVLARRRALMPDYDQKLEEWLS